MTQKYKRKYDPLTWKTTGPNKQRNLRHINYSLNEDDYENPEDYEWDSLLGEVISSAITDIARFGSSSEEYKTAHSFIFGQDLDYWCMAFGRNMDTFLVRKKTKDIIMHEHKREEYLRHVYDQQIRRRNEGRGNNKKLSSNRVSEESDTELQMGDEDSSS